MKQKLLFLLPSLVGGGAERTFINLLQKLDGNQYEIDLVVVVNKGAYVNQVPTSVHVIPLFHNQFFVRVLSWLQKKYGFVYLFKSRVHKKVTKKYDVGISFLDGNFTDLLFFMPGLTRRLTWVHSSYKSYRNFARFYENKKYRDKLKRERYGKLDGIYFVSHDSMTEFIEIFGSFPEMKVVYNLIDSVAILKKSKQTIENTTCFQFVALGSLLPVKGFGRLIRAAQIVKEKGFHFKVTIAGSGPEKKNLEALVNKYDLNTTIDFVGFIKNPYPLLKNADVFIMSSVSEALPTVLCEAMILGKATLVTNCSGCREIVANGKYGLMAEQDDQNLAAHMIKYLSDPNLVKYYEHQSSERAILFDDKIAIEAYNEIFNQ